MLTTIVGWLWILAGAFFFLKPSWLKSSLRREGAKRVRSILVGTALLVGVLLLGAAWDEGGIAGTVLAVFGVIAVLKAFFFLESAFTERALRWIETLPLAALRGIAVLYIALGVILILGVGRDVG